ncbi:hypothetical protein GQR58_026445 [Nymphon striatum]|nr:hypothetical protein GQR58_026445 [Nymphon striatum]
MLELEDTQPDVYNKFLSGLFVVRRSDRFWAGLPTDLVIEQTLMKTIKTTRGLTRGRGMDENQRTRWILAMPACAEVNEAMQEVAGTQYNTSDQHLDNSEARKSRDHNDTMKIFDYFQDYCPFKPGGELHNIATGITAGPDCNAHQANKVGERILAKMEGQDALAFSFRKKDKIEPIRQNTVTIGGESVSIDPQVLFQRLLIVANSSDYDVKDLLCYELFTLPTALFDKHGLLREANKPQLADVLSVLPIDEEKREVPKYHVLDGGSLIHRFPWKRGTTFDEILKTYLNYVKPLIIQLLHLTDINLPPLKILHTKGGQTVLTSRLFGIGKGVPLKKIKDDPEFGKQAEIFCKQSTKEEVKVAGENALLCLYGGEVKNTLDSLRMRKYRNMVIKSLSNVQIQKLPPTPDAAKFHSFRVYYQVQVWMGKGCELNPENWEWRLQNGKLEPRTINRAPAPDSILKIIHCGCKGGYDTLSKFLKKVLLCAIIIVNSLYRPTAEQRPPFSATSHGKGIIDGIGGRAKYLVRHKVMSKSSTPLIIQNSQDFANAANQLMEKTTIRVNVMEKAGTHYKWPNVQDNIFYSYDNVIMKLAPPVVAGNRGQFFSRTLKNSNIVLLHYYCSLVV